MFATPSQPLAAHVANGALGALAALSLGVVADIAGTGPFAVSWAVLIPLCLVALPVARWRAPWWTAPVGAALLWRAEDVGAVAFFARSPAPGLLVLHAVGVGLAGAAVGPVARGAGRVGGVVSTLVFAMGLFLPREFLVIAVASAGAWAGRGTAGAGDGIRPVATIFAASILALFWSAWVVVRAPLDPSRFSSVVFVIFAGIAFAPAGRWLGAVSAIVTVGGGAWLTARGDLPLGEVLGARDPRLVPVALGSLAGALAGACRPGPGLGLAVLPLSSVLFLVGPSLPTGIRARAVEAWATFGADSSLRERVRADTADMNLDYAGIGPAGSSALWTRGNNLLVDLDGTVADPTSRAGSAEYFAASLGSCATGGRDRVRVGGDDLGVVVRALRPHQFLAVDVAVPDRDLVRAQAERVPALSRAWLHPSVRLLALPSPVLVQLGRDADLVVDIVRTGWDDGRTRLPDARSLRAVRGTLAEGGVYALVLGTTRLEPGTLSRVAHEFAEVFPWAALSLPPDGVDSAILLGRRSTTPLDWTGFEECFAADRQGLSGIEVRSAMGLAGGILLGRDALLGLSSTGRNPVGMPAGLGIGRRLPILDLPLDDVPFTAIFDATAPAAELQARRASLAAFLAVVKAGRSGDIAASVEETRKLAGEPGGSDRLRTLVLPELSRARAAMSRASGEGIDSPAWKEAETALASARMFAPDLADTLCVGAELAEFRRDFSRAEDGFAACVAADPTQIPGFEGLARTRRVRGDLPGTEAALRASLALAPQRWRGSHYLGVFLLERGRFEEAERLLRDATRFSAEDDRPAAAPGIALAHLYLRTGRAGLALAEAQRASVIDPNASTWTLVGAARLELGQLDQAEEDLRTALRLGPTDIRARHELGRLQALRGDYALAAESFKSVLERDPSSIEARTNLERLAPLLDAVAPP